jgi:type VI secretion system secreted protein Hcp
MAAKIYATVVGAKQGTFKGEGITDGPGKGQIPGVGFTYGVKVPLAAASGAAAGKRQHQPVNFTKEWGVSSPQFYAAAYANEVLTSVTIQFTSMSADAKELVDHTIKLTNATIIEIEESIEIGQTGGPAVDSRTLQTISFIFQKIDIASSGGTEAMDTWQTTV